MLKRDGNIRVVLVINKIDPSDYNDLKMGFRQSCVGTSILEDKTSKIFAQLFHVSNSETHRKNARPVSQLADKFKV
jgi:hypothetical protein